MPSGNQDFYLHNGVLEVIVARAVPYLPNRAKATYVGNVQKNIKNPIYYSQ
jgi:hypothetical protein